MVREDQIPKLFCTETKSISSIIIKWQFEVPFQVFIAASSFVSYVNKLHLKKSATVEYFYFSCIWNVLFVFCLTDRHHFDNPVYSGAGPRPGTTSGGGLPLNNGCSRVVNHFSPSTHSTVKKHVNIERDKRDKLATANHYQEEETEEEENANGIIFFFQKKKKRKKIANTYLKFVWDAFSKALWTSILKVCFSFFFLGAFGCAAGAFSYATLSNRKNFEADALNPNLYSSLENLKDNRKMENLYDELSKKAIASATVPRRGMQL